MNSVTHKQFVLLINNQIDAVTQDWDNMRDYCSETGKRGQVFTVETKIPFGAAMSDISIVKRYFGEIG
jgi:hypothetical protein